MARIEKTVFISYRRTDVYTALAVYENLKNQGYDVFFDYRSISSGDFEQIITSNIRARAHFVLILTPTALDRCNEPGDWLRREIEIAIDEKRNLVPLFFKGFRFGAPSVTEKLTGKLKNLSRYNGLNVHEDYFDEAMYRLRTQYLSIPLETVLHPVSTEVQRVVRAEQVAADKALEQIEDVQELVKQFDETSNQSKATPKSKREKPVPAVDIPVPSEEIVIKAGTASENVAAEQQRTAHAKTQESPVPPDVAQGPTPNSSFKSRLLGGVIGGLLILGFLIWGASKLLRNSPVTTPEVTNTFQTNMASTIQPSDVAVSQSVQTNMPSPTRTSLPLTQTSIPPTRPPVLTGKDGMILLYVPASEFPMGSSAIAGGSARTVYLDAFWIDRTEVTNKQYALCISAGSCKPPFEIRSKTRPSYFGNSGFDNYPVIYLDWDRANAYCSWVGRRLPTEAEWEKAARGTDGRNYPWGEQVECAYANFVGLPGERACIGDTTEVGSYPNGQSPYGAYDMAGNVWEWVNDYFSIYEDLSSVNPQGPATGNLHVMRGGAWNTSGYPLLSAYRDRFHSGYTDYNSMGFRCAMSATP